MFLLASLLTILLSLFIKQNVNQDRLSPSLNKKNENVFVIYSVSLFFLKSVKYRQESINMHLTERAVFESLKLPHISRQTLPCQTTQTFLIV